MSEIGDWNSGQLLSPFLDVVLTSLGFTLWRATGGVTYIETYINRDDVIKHHINQIVMSNIGGEGVRWFL